MRFSTKLTILFSTIILASGIVISYLVYTSTVSTSENIIKDKLRNQALHTLEEIDRILFERYADIKVLASDHIISSRNSTPRQITERLIEYKNNYKIYASLSLFNLDRMRIADTDGANIGKQHSFSEYWKGIAQGKEIVVEISQSESLNQVVFHFASLVKDKNRIPFGVVVSRVPLENLYDIIRHPTDIYDVKRDFKIDLVDKEGFILFSNYNKKGMLKESTHHWDEIKSYIVKGAKSGNIKYVNPQGEAEILFFAKEQGYLDFKGSDWILIMEVPVKVAFASAAKLRNEIIIVSAILGFLAIAIVFFFSRRVSETISKISAAADDVAKGKMDIKIETTSKDETGRLAHAFNKMVEDLKDAQDRILAHSRELETIVAERTAELKQVNERLELELVEHKQAEEALRESEEKYRTLVLLSKDAIFGVRNDKSISYASPACLDIFGYTPEEFIANPELGVKIIHPDSHLQFVEFWEHYAKTKKFPEEVLGWKCIRKDNTIVYTENVNANIYNDAGDVVGFQTIARDITERKLAEEKLRVRERQQAVVAELGQRALEDVDLDRLMQDIVSLLAKTLNADYCKILELLPDSKSLLLRTGVGWKEGAVGHAIVGADTDSQAGYTLISHGPIIVPDLRTETRFGAPKLLIDHNVISGMSVVIEGWKRPFGVLGVHTRQQREFTVDDAHFLHAVANLLAAAIERKRMEDELFKTGKLESLGILAGGIAHDFNNLLTGIIGNISFAKTIVKPDDKIYSMLEKSEEASLKAKDLTNQLITFAKGGTPIKQLVCIGDLIKETASFAVSGSSIKCEFKIPDDLWSVEVDEGQIKQVISNMIINAEQAMPKGGMIKVRAENIVIGSKDTLLLKEGRYIRIFIIDQGVGISKELFGKIFDPYFTTKQNRTGLGLTTAYSIIYKHRGLITVDSEPGAGTTFCIYLPASQKTTADKKGVEREGAAKVKRKILVMDDEKMILELTYNILQSIGYEVELARDGKEAIELYRKAKETNGSFDVVIIDLTIPGGMGGREAIKELLKIDPHVKAIVSSGYSNDPIMADYETYGFKGVIAKPYSIQELRRAVSDVINGK